jgi:hypothetical protein
MPFWIPKERHSYYDVEEPRADLEGQLVELLRLRETVKKAEEAAAASNYRVAVVAFA